MEELAKKLLYDITQICGGYRIEKNENVLNRASKMAMDIQVYCESFLQGNTYGMEEGEYEGLRAYVLQVLKDYIEALEQQDMVWMLDTLDYGLRDLAMIYMDEEGDTIGEVETGA